MSEIVGCSAFVYSVLSGDTTLNGLVGSRIYDSFAPEAETETTFPFITFNFQTGSDLTGQGTHRFFSKLLYQIKVIGNNGLAALQPIAARIDSLLTVSEVQSISIGSITYNVLGSYRDRPIQYPEVSRGNTLTHLGGLYRIHIEPA